MTHVLISILGLAHLFVILRSMIRIALMNRHYRDFFAVVTGRAVHKAVVTQPTPGNTLVSIDTFV